MAKDQAETIDLSTMRLRSEFGLGCCRLTEADKLPLTHVFVCLSKSDVSIAFWGDTKGVWNGTTLVNVNMFRYPSGKTEFLRQQEFFGEERKSQARLPEGIAFDESQLRVQDIPTGWTHTAFARSNRDFIHLYESKRGGVLVRFLGRKGSILDNPLIKSIASNLRFLENQWIVEYPQIETRNEIHESATDGASSSADEELSKQKRKRATTKIDLARDKERIRRYIEKRIKDYSIHENCGPGEDADPIQAVMLGFYATQGGYVYLVFDTRPGKNIDGEWTLHIEESTIFNLPKWTDFYEHICEGNRATIILADGTEKELRFSPNDERAEKKFNGYIGEMLRTLMVEMNQSGTLARLPLRKNAFMMVEEFDGYYFWPGLRSVTTKGRIQQ